MENIPSQSNPQIVPQPIQQSTQQTEKPKSSKTKWILIIFGALEFLIPLSYLLFVLPQLQSLYKSLNISIPWTFYLNFVLFVCMILMGVMQILIGILSLDAKLGRNKTKAVIILGLILPILLITITIIGGFAANVAVNSMVSQELK
jgi:hypothetical protein